MATITYSNQLKFTGAGYLDANVMPVKDYTELKKIPMKKRFEGFEIVVLEDENSGGNQAKYWLVGGITNACWKKKEYGGGGELPIEGDDVENNNKK